MTRKPALDRVSTAAFTFWTISAIGTTALPSKWPQRFGKTWSSSWIALAPARSNRRTVRTRLSALPKPVSPSAMIGKGIASRQAAMCDATSVAVVRPRSGAPSQELAMPAPVR